MRDDTTGRLHANLGRVRAIVAAYQDRAGSGSGRRTVATVDLLRAAVVFLHATMEDVLRTVLEWKWPAATSRELFEAVPVVGSNKLKVELADLLAHRGCTVDELIRLSVQAHVERSNFNHIGDIKRALARAGLDASLVAPYQRRLAVMMGRRHLIVHRADRLDQVGSGHHGASSLGQALVAQWIEDVGAFCNDVVAHL